MDRGCSHPGASSHGPGSLCVSAENGWRNGTGVYREKFGVWGPVRGHVLAG